MVTCIGITASKRKCNNKVLVGQYCHYHQFQQVKNEPKVESKTLIINTNDKENQIGNDPCSICLCDVEETDNVFLICEHPHHVACVKQLIEPFCPVCRGPLKSQSKKTKIDLNVIKEKSAKEKALREKEAMQSSIQLATELNQENLPNIYNLPVINQEQELLDKILQESLLSAELDDYERIAKMAEDSYYFAQKEDEALLERIMKENIEINKHDWCEEDLKTLMKGKSHITIQLK